VGWKRTAALWGAYDREAETWFLYAEHYRGHAEPSVHAAAIRARGEWIPGCIDPAARGRSQDDGKKLTDSYRDLGLELYLADHAVEVGIFDVYQRLSTGTLKVFTLLRSWLAEYRIYRRDELGRIAEDGGPPDGLHALPDPHRPGNHAPSRSTRRAPLAATDRAQARANRKVRGTADGRTERSEDQARRRTGRRAPRRAGSTRTRTSSRPAPTRALQPRSRRPQAQQPASSPSRRPGSCSR
jgi:hypothetical protein